MKNAGWPASDGIFSILELPSSPWQAVQSWSFSASGPLCAIAGMAPASKAASPRAGGCHHFVTTRIPPLPVGRLRVAVADAVDRAVGLVGDQQRTVLDREHIGWPAVVLVLLLVEKPGHERLDLGLAAGRLGDHHVIAELLLPVPGAVPRDEGDVLVLLGEHVAGVELDAKPGRMRSGQRRRQDHAGARVRA